MRGIILMALLGIAGCASPESIRESEPIWTGEYRGTYRPFGQCLALAMQGPTTVQLRYDHPVKTARLLAYGRVLYSPAPEHETLVRDVSTNRVLVELRSRPAIGTSYTIDNVKAAAESCQP